MQDLFYLGMAFEILGYGEAVGVMLPHSNGQGFQAAVDHVAVVG